MKRIVAEISRNWPGDKERPSPLLSELFEEVIERNLERGFALESWRLTAVTFRPHDYESQQNLVETIVAVFVGPEP